MSESPIEQLLVAVDKLDTGAVMALMAPDVRFLGADGQRAEGSDAFGDLLADLVASLRSTSHHITAQWHQDDVWIAEVEATYELTDGVRTPSLPRAYVARQGTQGLLALSVYGAHERPLSDYDTGERMLRIGGQWMPPL